ncbi:MAG: hypothetical protein VX438_11715, partial [Planctomycetota bacterium]|nr:hypothetical protein [Planctomycetota bacterium]
MKPNKRIDLENSQKQLKRLGDFSTRAVKIRLFGLVCGVMLVLVLMFEARKPQNWDWMGFERTEPTIDTRYLRNLYGSGDQGEFKQFRPINEV